jgi:hypothetical protein
MKTTTQINQLREHFPLIFPDRCEVSVGSGWHNILTSAFTAIQCHIDNSKQQREKNIQYNLMAESLRLGDDTLFQAQFESFRDSPDWLDRRREEIMCEPYRVIQDPCTQFVAVQIKEKFGTLRLYHDGGDDYCRGVVAMAEIMSGGTCEMCGAPGTIGGKGWIRTLCARHHMEEA